MRPLTLEDVQDRATFVAQRPQHEAEFLRTRALRRLALGPNMTLLFENQATVLWQVQEMCRVENITQPAAVQFELDTYNPLLPSQSELSATLLVEYPEEAERKVMLTRLTGLQAHLRLRIEGVADAPAVFEQGREREDGKISSVQFLRVPLSPEQRAAFFDLSRKASFVVDHPAYSHEAALSGASRGALIDDISR